jgi:F-type H+-transporting ATPase subunit b
MTRAKPALTVQIAGALVLGLGLVAAPAFAQTAPSAEKPAGSEQERAAAGVAGDAPKASEPGSEHHTGGPSAEDEEVADPSKHFNFLGIQPGHLFDYSGKDEMGGPFGDGKMTDPETGRTIHEEEPASPPFVFVLVNFAILLGLLAWKGWPIGQQVARERHDLIKTALDEAARLRQEAADKLAGYEKRLAAADAEIQQLVTSMRADAQKEKDRILAAAQAQAAQMKRDAEQRIAAEIEHARAELTREVTAAATAATEKLLREKLAPADQHKLVAGFIADVQTAAGGTPRGVG